MCCIAIVACVAWLSYYIFSMQTAAQQLSELQVTYVKEAQSSGSLKRIQEQAQVLSTETGQEAAEAEVPEPSYEDLLAEYDVPEKEIDFTGLQEENADIYAWITIPDTVIDYPVLQREDEWDYYLKHNVDGSEGYPGCIFSQYMNSKDFTDNVTVLYGHNMRSGEMFADLHEYEDEDFFEQHPYFYIYRPDEILVYQVFAAYKYSDDHILLSNDTESEAGFEAYIQSIYDSEGLFAEDIRPTTEDKVLDLSTCIRGESEKRWIVSAVLAATIEEAE